MKVKAKDLKGTALAWAVAKAEGIEDERIVLQRRLHLPGEAVARAEARVKVRWLAKAHTPPEVWAHCAQTYTPSMSILEREDISVIRCDDDYETDAQGYATDKRIPVWAATIGPHSLSEIYGSQGDNYGDAYTIDETDVVYGSTMLEAGMRCRVIKALSTRNRWDLDLNAEIDIPEELL